MLEQEFTRLAGIADDIGNAALHSLYPDEFEYYAISFELLRLDGSTEAYFLMPIMPTSISTSNPPVTNISKTAGGVLSQINPSFNIKSIQLVGDFGRNLKIVTTEKNTNLFGVAVASFTSRFKATLGAIKGVTGLGSKKDAVFSQFVKNGYGANKVLEKILDQSTKLDENGNPYILIYNNLSFNEQYIVEPTSMVFSQDVNQNMIWKYNVSLQAVAPASSFLSDENLKLQRKTILKNVIVNRALKEAQESITSVTSNAITNQSQQRKSGAQTNTNVNVTSQNVVRNSREAFSDEIDRLTDVTGIDIRALLDSYNDFLENDYNRIYSFYSGNSEIDISDNLDNLDLLIANYENLVQTIDVSNNDYQSTFSWDFLIFVENIINSLKTVTNLDRLLRFNQNSVNAELSTNNYQNLQDLSTQIGNADPDNDFQTIANNNQLYESDYDIQEGVTANVELDNTQNIFTVNDVIGSLAGLGSLGIDIDRLLSFDVDNQDLNILSNEDTFGQAIDTVLEPRNGDDPSFRSLFVNPDIFIGNRNVALLRFPIFTRQLQNAVDRDDTIASFTIDKIRTEGDSIYIDITFTSVNSLQRQATAQL